MTDTDDLPNIPGEDLDDVREHINRMPPAAFPELRTLALQMIEDLEDAYRRINVAYERLLGDAR